MLATGENSSWCNGHNHIRHTRKAAEGNNAWTNTQYKIYNYNEKYQAGCYNFSAFTQNPNLSINHIQDIESKRFYFCISPDMELFTWQRLGCKRLCGDNWYNNLINNYYNQ
ncbi:MAG: hypothetical protein R2801_03995 [Chitinophagales bacterium]